MEFKLHQYIIAVVGVGIRIGKAHLHIGQQKAEDKFILLDSKRCLL